MNKKTFSAFTLAALMSAGIATAELPQAASQPQGKAHGKHQGKNQRQADGLPHGFARLNLSEAQKAQIKRISEQYRRDTPAKQPENRSNWNQKVKERREREQALLSAKTFNEQAARALIAEQRQEREQAEAERTERQIQRLKARHAMFQVLTPEQRKLYLEQTSRHHGGKGHSGKAHPHDHHH